MIEAPAPTAAGGDVTTGDVDLQGEWTLLDVDPSFTGGPARGRISRLVQGLRSDAKVGPRMSYRGATMEASADPAPARARPESATPLAAPLASPLIAVLDARVEEDDVVFAPADIETIIGRPLPGAAAHEVRWWMLSGQPWRRAGYAATLDTDAGCVTFHRL